ncbi:hypothetical protein ACFQV2_12825 [Actinokineospora soli]|uniref:Uncharacterized protein n=1 Tax=Actinokineospora soli TaxID=1048753 RepID=A0ABW2TM90_9PSEU
MSGVRWWAWPGMSPVTGVPRTGSIPAFVPTDAVLLRAAVGDVVSKFYDIGGRGCPSPAASG